MPHNGITNFLAIGIAIYNRVRAITAQPWLGSYGADPVVYRDANGQKIGDSIVGHAVSNDLALALGLGDRFEIGLTLPTLYLQGAGFDGDGLSSFGVGDARLILKSLLTSNNRGFVASFRLASDMPLSQLNENTS